jgi:hypothetical protein
MSSYNLLNIPVNVMDTPRSMEVEVSPKSENKSDTLSDIVNAGSPLDSARSAKSNQSTVDIPFDKNKLDYEQRALLEEKMVFGTSVIS